ncbi:zf-TFIIB domain-containing protein [Blastococcus xanthinilyticus]|uniref:Transcription factor zinc-finger domain-containing protein n=1 Tax=Blastococcus xanthinilyticus TaxID=1564164 RepID=A0A5S5D4G0_9ACTN|nr:zf-TFIIB domain-containing protein [Blastococcus xanthinilyticus]TYP90314.1 hypothetical protein BD833_10132 [Blastococcus xanthinilyticus]
MELTCPKCHGAMRTYERNGVHVDQCADCRGIFLDRGELDRLIDAENAWHGDDAPRRPEHGERDHRERDHRERDHREGEYREREYREHGEHGRQHTGSQPGAGSAAGLSGVVGEVLRQVQGASHSSHSSPYSKRRKKESFLGDLFG